MPSDTFDLSEYYRNRRFNEMLDDQESPLLSVVFRSGDQESILGRGSLALYHGDLELYREQASRYAQDEVDTVLTCSSFPRNQRRFEELRLAVRHGFVIPFIGAGISVNAGCPLWREYLGMEAVQAGLNLDDIARLLDAGRFDELLDKIIDVMGNETFEQNFARSFVHSTLEGSAAWWLPEVFQGPVITTNFDRVLEEVYARQQLTFTEKILGTEGTGRFVKSIPRGERYLFKIHGNVDYRQSRVLTKREYNSAYGSRGIDLSKPLPQVLRRIYSSYSLLFLGCSLTIDRTVKLFSKVFDELGGDNLPNHYAIIEAPHDVSGVARIESKLGRVDIHRTSTMSAASQTKPAKFSRVFS